MIQQESIIASSGLTARAPDSLYTHTHIQPGVCLHGEFRPGDKNAIGIGVEPLAVANPGSSDVDGDVLLAHPLLVGLHRVRAESPDTDVAAVDLNSHPRP